MARQLFVNAQNNEALAEFIQKNLFEPESTFREKLSTFLTAKIKKEIEPISNAKIRDNLYFIGSFSRDLGGYGSDLDLILFGEENSDLEVFNTELRLAFRSYSLKVVSSLDELVEISDAKGILSSWFISPVFNGLPLVEEFRAKAVKRENEVESFLIREHTNRVSRYGKVPGRIHFNIKQSPGGLVDLRQLSYLASLKGEALDIKGSEDFLYKIRVLNSFSSNSDTLQVNKVKDYRKWFDRKTDADFYKDFFKHVSKIFASLQSLKGIDEGLRLDRLFKEYGFEPTQAELSSAHILLSDVEGLVLAPSYHTWTADQHTLKCIEEIGEITKEFQGDFKISQKEAEVLLWAAFFHDIKKGKSEPHSFLGAQAVQKFGAEHQWSSDKIELISWLVREHLTLVTYSFKSDPFEPEFIKNLSLRRCTGRRAELLFLLSCADLKATNPASWSDWKKRILKQALGQILGEEDKLKNELVEALDANREGQFLASKLSLKEICLVPYDVLKKDLLSFFSEGYAFYEFDQKIWVRSYRAHDEPQYAKKFMNTLFDAGAYIHHALFKTFEDGIYNWACVEAGVSKPAFEKRFRTALLSYEKGKVKDLEYKFKRIRTTFLKEDYAVLSFKGDDKKGALSEAIRILDAADLNIEWGHAVTWGDQIEDVFGVSFEGEPDWSFLT